MAVTVVTSRYNNGRPGQVELFADADSFGMRDGHLMVVNSSGGFDVTVGIFAPGKWESAFTDSTMKSVTQA